MVLDASDECVGDVLDIFNPWVADWFRRAHGEPTEPQREAWPLIHKSNSVLIHAPTGSGKTLAAFMSALDMLHDLGQDKGAGVRVLYVSPLKALNYDIERNLREPLRGISATAERFGVEVGDVRVGVRTGDTSSSERARIVNNPPEILITTPESLYLVLTSPRARDILRSVETVIVDEIHTLCNNKRGVHLSISLERLERLSPSFQRIGLSATQRPLSEVARLLGGQQVDAVGDEPESVRSVPRPVEIVDCPGSKDLRVEVIGMPHSDSAARPDSVWPLLIPKVLSDIDDHDTTLVFTNSRRQAENTTDRLNSAFMARESGEDIESAIGSGEKGSGVEDGPFMAHHGSISDKMRREIERDLKEGKLPALVGTSTLELGIDIGSIDLVVQLQSPKSVTQGLQRVGRSGHSVGATSAGRIYATHPEDLIESAVVARGMLDGHVEEIRSPSNALDVLAQQIVASVAVEDWNVVDLYRLFRGAYPYCNLSYGNFEGVLKLVSGHYPRDLFSSLRARVHWDRTRGVLEALPGTRMMAVSNGGAIVDRGEFSVHLPGNGGKTRIGELDEEFVYESGEGDAFMLGSQVWRITRIEDDRVIAEPAPGAVPRMPFWRGDFPWRPFDLSMRVAKFRAEVAKRLRRHMEIGYDPPEVIDWLKREYPLDDTGARGITAYVRGQLEWGDAISSDESIVVETYQDAIGDRRMVIHSPFGGRVNGPWSVALGREIAKITKNEPEVQVSDDGIMFRLTESDSVPPVDLVCGMTVDQVKELVMDGMIDSALFGAVFRQNASRALLLPSAGNWRRTPFWLQRLRSKDLLSIAKSFPDFPMVLESYRDTLEDFMDMPSLNKVIDRIQSGEIRVTHVESNSPSPVARALDFYFTGYWLYEWDIPKAERGLQALNIDRAALADLFRNPESAGLLRSEAIDEVSSLANRRSSGSTIRSAAELAQVLSELGDLSDDEIADRSLPSWRDWIVDLAKQGRVKRLDFGDSIKSDMRWVSSELYDEYSMALWDVADFGCVRKVVARYLARSGPVPLAVLSSRYPISVSLLLDALDEMVSGSEVARGYFSDSGEEEWMDLAMLSRIQERTLSILRSEVEPVSALQYQSAVLGLHGITNRAEYVDSNRLASVLDQLQGVSMLPRDWMNSVFPSRIAEFKSSHLGDLISDGEYSWVFCGDADESMHKVMFVKDGCGSVYVPGETLARIHSAPDGLSGISRDVYEFLSAEGVATSETIVSAMNRHRMSDIADAMRYLALSGLVTCDSWSAALVIGTPSSTPQRSLSREVSGNSSIHRHVPRRGRAGTRGVRRHFVERMKSNSSILPSGASWLLTRRFGFLGPDISEEELAEQRVNTLLARHGVVTKRALELDGLSWDWRLLYRALNLMELRGVARRGYFVHGLPGVQFALPDFVEDVRSLETDKSDVCVLSLNDPAFVFDRELARMSGDGASILSNISRNSGTRVVFIGGNPILVAHSDGQRLSVADASDSDVMRALLALLDSVKRGSSPYKLEIREWNGEPVLQSAGAEILGMIGFRRDFPHMVIDFLSASALTFNY